MARGASLIIFFSSHLHCVFFSHHPPFVSIFFNLLSHHLPSLSFPLVLSSTLPSRIIPPAAYSIPSICPLFLFVFFFAFGMARDALPVIPPLHHLPHPAREREREGVREKRSEKEKEDWEEGMRGAGERKGGRSETKRKDHAASWLNEHGQRVITIEYIMLLLVEAIN